MKPIQRLQLIERIASELQDRMVTADINAYLPAFGISFGWQPSCGSKRVYVKEILTRVGDDILFKVAEDLGLPVPGFLDNPARALGDYLNVSGPIVCREDFGRALDSIASDPASAVGLACTTMESICKAILEGLEVSFPFGRIPPVTHEGSREAFKSFARWSCGRRHKTCFGRANKCWRWARGSKNEIQHFSRERDATIPPRGAPRTLGR